MPRSILKEILIPKNYLPPLMSLKLPLPTDATFQIWFGLAHLDVIAGLSDSLYSDYLALNIEWESPSQPQPSTFDLNEKEEKKASN